MEQKKQMLHVQTHKMFMSNTVHIQDIACQAHWSIHKDHIDTFHLSYDGGVIFRDANKLIIALVGNHLLTSPIFLPISRNVPINIIFAKSDPILDHLQISTMKNTPKNAMDFTLTSW